MVKLGTVSVDGSKFEANASKHRSVRYPPESQEPTNGSRKATRGLEFDRNRYRHDDKRPAYFAGQIEE